MTVRTKKTTKKPAKKGGINPKDVFGATKTPLDLIPPIGAEWEAAAFADGAVKYGPANWRLNAVQARIYIAACKRHLDLWIDGQRLANDSGVHHLGHARACLGILLDAEATGNLADDRPIPAFEALLAVRKEIADLLTAKKAKSSRPKKKKRGN